MLPEFILFLCGLNGNATVWCQTAIVPSQEVCEFHLAEIQALKEPVAVACFPKSIFAKKEKT